MRPGPKMWGSQASRPLNCDAPVALEAREIPGHGWRNDRNGVVDRKSDRGREIFQLGKNFDQDIDE